MILAVKTSKLHRLESSNLLGRSGVTIPTSELEMMNHLTGPTN